MENDAAQPGVVFVNLLREERPIDETSAISRSLRDVERVISGSVLYEKINAGLSKLLNVEKEPLGNAAMHEQVEAFRTSLRRGECGVIAHGNAYSIVDNRFATDPERSRMTALGVERVLKDAGCTQDMPVILYSCNTGSGQNSLAQELSAYHPTVVAPDGVIAQFMAAARPGIFKGDETTGDIDWSAPSKWRVFSHGREIAAYDWGSDMIHQTPSPASSGPER